MAELRMSLPQGCGRRWSTCIMWRTRNGGGPTPHYFPWGGSRHHTPSWFRCWEDGPTPGYSKSCRPPCELTKNSSDWKVPYYIMR